jgi:multidrug efflux pump subunit AcrA (membrane-fusion protein)
MNWKPVIYPVLVVAVAGGIGSWLMANPASSLSDVEDTLEIDPLADAPTVATIAPSYGAYAPQIQLYGQLQSGQQVIMNSPANADVLSVPVFEGDLVEAGDLLVQLDTTTLSRQVSQLQARRMDLIARLSVEQAQHDANKAALEVEQQLVDIARRSVTRLTNLKSQNLSSSAELENAERTLQTQLLSLQNRELSIARFSGIEQQYRAQLIELDSQIEQAEEQLAEASVTAPFSAKVSQVEVQVGASLNAGQTLMTLVDPDQQEIVAWVSANALDSVPSVNGLKGELENANQVLPVQLTHADPSANAGSLRLFFETDSSMNSLILNRFYRMWINLPTVEAFAVPESSVYSNQYVYAIEDNQLVRLAVDVIGERYQEGQLWRLVNAQLNGKQVLVTRLENAAQGLAVRESNSTQNLAFAE